MSGTKLPYFYSDVFSLKTLAKIVEFARFWSAKAPGYKLKSNW